MRGFTDGVADSLYTTFALLAAIRYFEASGAIKSILVASAFIGLFFTPLTQIMAARTGWKVNRVAACWYGLCGILLFTAAWQSSLALFVTAAALAFFIRAQAVPLITHIYVQNYERNTRGRRFSTTLMVMSICSVTVGLAGGKLMDIDTANYRLLFIAGGLAGAGGFLALWKIPSNPLDTHHAGKLWTNLSLIWQHQVFGWVLFGWMLMGISNLMTMPLRVEYLAQEAYGLNYSNFEIGIVTVSIPVIMRVLSIKIWGMLFDRFALLKLRIVANMIFLFSIILFFTSRNLVLIIVASTLFGIAQGAGGVMWNLWVTKLAPPEKTSAYMSIHTGLTGVRGSLAPFIAYTIIFYSTPQTAAWVAVGLITASSLIFLYVWNRYKEERF